MRALATGGLLFVWAALAACAAPAGSRPQDPAAAVLPGPVLDVTLAKDARPEAYGPDEVDVPARPVEPVRPVYPAELQALGREGDVEARVLVRADGSVGGARLLEGSDESFAPAVREALREARFHPARRDGRAVSSWVVLRLRFRLEE